MKKSTLAFIAPAIVIITLFSMTVAISLATANGDYEIQHIDHNVKVLNNGYILINDTIETSEQVVTSFLIGFPNKYGPYVIRCDAYEAGNRSTNFPVDLDVPLQDHMGFYAAKVDLSQKPSQNFTVEFLLSNTLLLQDTTNTTLFTLVFPGLPSLTSTATSVNASIVLPESAQYYGGTVDSFEYSKSNLPAFAYNESVVKFTLFDKSIRLFDISQLNREIVVTSAGELVGSDTYSITNKSPVTMDSVEVILPLNASTPSAEDQFGRPMDTPTLAEANTTRYAIKLAVETGKPTKFIVNYGLPREVYVRSAGGTNSYVLNATMVQDMDYFIDQASMILVLPDGARFSSLERVESGSSYAVERGVFQERVTVARTNMVSLGILSVEISYEYNSLWSGLSPTLCIWALLSVGCVVVAVARRPKAPTKTVVPSVTTRVGPELIRSFADSYEEKLKLMAEMDSLESKVQKGKIPRRRYKVQRRTLEARIDTLSRSLEDSEEKMHAAGGHYSGLTRQLEVAETEMNEAQANLRSIETRHGRGEISLESYRKLLDEYQRRREKAATTIDGILLRLREEIR